MPKRTQVDHVEEELMKMPQPSKVNNVVIPGIKVLHQKSVNDIAEVLAMVIKSASNIQELKYVIGSHIEITTL